MSTTPDRWPAGSATGLGSMPGTDVREATRVVFGELPVLPHLPELPERGVGADATGRTAALLVDLHVEVQPSGWRVTSAAGRDERRAAAILVQDLDALEEMATGWAGPLKIQVAGPWTLAATLELRHGDKALSDAGACRDLAASLGEGLAQHVSDVSRRVPAAQLLVQLDESRLPEVLGGTVPTASGFGQLAAVADEVVVAGLATACSRLPAGALRLIHCCAPDAPVEVLRRVPCDALCLDLVRLPLAAEDVLGEAIEAGLALMAGAVDVDRMVTVDGGASSVVADSVGVVRGVWRRTGLSAQQLAAVCVTPTCGLAGRSPEVARAALAAARETAHRLAEDPEGDLDG